MILIDDILPIIIILIFITIYNHIFHLPPLKYPENATNVAIIMLILGIIILFHRLFF